VSETAPSAVVDEMSPGRRRRAALVLVLTSTALALLLAEVFLRVAGVGPWAPFAALAEAPRMTAPDAELGWIARPGTWRWRPDPDQPPVTVQIAPDGGRGVPAPARTWILGGSFAQGFAVDEHEHLAAHLHQARSFGVPGYGTLQSARLYQRLRQDHPAPDTVVYGLVDHHDARNACTRSWLHTLDRAAGAHPYVQCPWAHWDGARLQTHPPRTYTHWSASEHLAVVDLLERGVIDLLDRPLNRKTETTVQLVRAWRDQVEADGARFVVALLWAPQRHRAYTSRLRQEGVELVDLTDLGYPDGDTAVPVDGHPSAALHARWAERLAPRLARASAEAR